VSAAPGTVVSDDRAMGTPADVHIVDLVKTFAGDVRAVDHITVDIPAGSFFALLGPSGCGKTTTLRMLGGLEIPTSGRIYLGDDDITDRKPYRRPVNTVFQNYALFPHLSITENVAFGLRRKGRRGPEVLREVERMLELVELGGLGRRRPSALSGGQQQRVALARALINHPQVLLLDEPLGALDLKLRKQMQLELKRIQTEVGITFVHVTHDQEEAMTMADTIAVMRAGRVEQIGSPAELYEHPRNEFVANFLGQSNLLDATVRSRDGDHAVVDVHGMALRVPAGGVSGAEAVRIGVRPEKIDLMADGTDGHHDRRNALPGTVVDSSFIGVSIQYVVRTAWGDELMVVAQNRTPARGVTPGSAVTLRWEPEQTFVLDEAA
jgi:spermidine/putrescine transport system ATP-binding protein